MKIVEWAPEDAAEPASTEFVCYSTTRSQLELHSIIVENGHKSTNLKDHRTVTNLLCVEWCKSWGGRLNVWGNQAGSVTLINWNKDNVEEVICAPPGKGGRRSCTSVSWNSLTTSQVAAGFDLLKNEHCVNVWDLNDSEPLLGQVGLKPLLRLCFEEATSSLAWLPDSPHMLAVGTSMGWVRVFDTRQGEQAAVDVSLMAHPGARHRKVKGIRPDPFHPHLLGTFSDTPQESVKIWDLRKGVSSKSKLTPVATISPHGGSDGQYNSQSAVTDAAWSTSRENVLAVSTSHHKQVLLYSTAVRSTNPDDVIRTPYHSVPTMSAVRSLSWQCGGSNRLLVATSVGVADILVVESVPLAVSSLGIAAAAANKVGFTSVSATQGGTELPWRDMEKVMCERSSCGYSLDAGKNLQVLSDELDYMCSSSSSTRGYGNSSHSAHGGSAFSTAYPTPTGSPIHSINKNINPMLNAAILRQTLQLIRVWGWVDRVEALHDDDVTVTNCGVLDIVRNASSVGASIEKKHPRFDLPVYSSAEVGGSGTGAGTGTGARERIRQVCGWASALTDPQDADTAQGGVGLGKPAKFPRQVKAVTRDEEDGEEEDEEEEEEEEGGMSELEALVDECEAADSVERASALAMWHGHPELAIRILQQYAEKYVPIDSSDFGHGSTNHTCGHGWDEVMTPEYLQLLNLVAMCFAGHGGGQGRGNMWVAMCERVLVQLNNSRRSASAYLAAICRFLLESLPNASASGYSGDSAATATVDYSSRFDCVIRNEALILEDRLGFASFYLADAPLLIWVQSLAAEYTKEGRLEGLLLCGLQGDGTHILQEYVNRHEDVQTAALLVGRNIRGKLPEGPDGMRNLSGTAFSEWSWLYEYRIFLNRSQLFMSRASLDVELGRRQRLRAEVEVSGQALGAPGKSAIKAAPASGAGAASAKPTSAATAAVDRRSSNSRVLYALPAHNDFPHIFLRCNYCSSSLPVDAMQQQQHTAFLRKQKPVINFCPSCKKPLPRCYVCQLYMGLVNPHAEVSRILAQKRRLLDRAKAVRAHAQGIEKGTAAQQAGKAVSSVQQHSQQDLDEHNVLEFGRWLFFCQKCKHGGHASCIDHWFEGESESVMGGEVARRTVCGVNGCDCQCSYS